MPFENMEFDEHSAPISPTSQAWIQECAEQDLRGLLCDTFRNQQDWMIAAKKVLYHPEATPEVSVTYMTACVLASLPPFFCIHIWDMSTNVYISVNPAVLAHSLVFPW